MSLKISRILHAGYVFQHAGIQVAFDPIFENPFSVNCFAFPSVRFDIAQIKTQKFAAVFISHFHDDHCSFESLNLLDRQTPIYMYCLHEQMFSLLRQLGFKYVHSLQLDQAIKVGQIEVVAKRALDVEIDCLFHVRAEGLNVLNVVDSWIDEETIHNLAKTSWDMVLWPFQTMREVEVLSPTRAKPASGEIPFEWHVQLKMLSPRYLVPNSCQFKLEDWSWYNQAFFPISYAQFQQQVQKILPHTKVLRLDPSSSVLLDQGSLIIDRPLDWVHTTENESLDYLYNPDVAALKTQQIAKKFPPLQTEQKEVVNEYCQKEILQRYKEIGPSIDLYFNKVRIWRLTTFDHEGSEKNYFYELSDDNMRLVDKDFGQLAWTTEVPINKLYAALKNGESLTSMYVRINDIQFAPELERNIKEIDVMQDPLVRCLFNNSFATYQKAQLIKLRKSTGELD